MSRAVRLTRHASFACAGVAALALVACHRGPFGSRALPAPRAAAAIALAPSVADSVRSEWVARGVTLHTVVNVAGPWRAYILDVDLRCNALQAVKGATTAVGRSTTSQLLSSLPASRRAVGAVNADFFLFAPPGVPTNAHVENGTFIAGPDNRPVFWQSANGAVGFDTLRITGTLTATATPAREARVDALTTWNRPAVRASGIVDARWGVPLDSVVRRRFWRLDPVRVTRAAPGDIALRGRYVVREPRAQDTLVFGDTLALHLAPNAAAPTIGEEVTVALSLTSNSAFAAGRPAPTFRDVVGGRPMLVADSTVARDADTDGAASFRDLNPRTLLGLNARGTRAWLVVVDGRQKGYSMGMTLRQEADLMLAMGATRAINLDGGGSSALVLRDVAGAVRTVNKPSDAGGERPVANALGVVPTCR